MNQTFTPTNLQPVTQTLRKPQLDLIILFNSGRSRHYCLLEDKLDLNHLMIALKT